MKKVSMILASMCLLLSLCACGETAEPVETAASEATEAPVVETTPVETEHVHSYVDTVVGPFCTAGGFTKHRCECGDLYVDSQTDPIGHDWNTFDVPATDCTQGYTDFTCNTCGVHCTDNYVPANWWDTDEAMEAVVADLTAYAEGLGLTVATEGEVSEEASVIPVEEEGNSTEVVTDACKAVLDNLTDAGSVTILVEASERYGHLISIG